MKHPQHILAFDKSAFGINGLEGFVRIAPKQFFESAGKSLFIGRRAELESDERFGQVLPYIVLWTKLSSGTKVFAYQRTKKVGEERLAGAISVGTGGHVDLLDVRSDDNSVIDIVTTFAVAIARELNEEIGFAYEESRELTFDAMRTAVAAQENRNIFPRFAGMINDPSNEVGRVHYGCVFSLEIPRGYLPFCREEELESIGLVDPGLTLAIDSKSNHLENWSRIVLQNIDLIAV